MRTTLTIDDDIAATLEALRRRRGGSLKHLVNEVLRRGLQDMKRPTKRHERFSTQAVALGRVRVGSLDNVYEALAVVESELFR